VPWQALVPWYTHLDGAGFAADTPYRVFFDSNRDGDYDAGEPEFGDWTTIDGYLPSLDFYIPAGVPAGDYQIRCDCPIGGPIEAWGTFTVLP
jgi:hypothetical protein